MNDSEALGFIRGARALLKDEQEKNDSRELFIVITKLDEAEMWLSKDITFKTPKENLKDEKESTVGLSEKKKLKIVSVTCFRNPNYNKGQKVRFKDRKWTVDSGYTEICDQDHQMWAEGTSIGSGEDLKPEKADIQQLLASEGWIAYEIDIRFDRIQKFWRWVCRIKKEK